MKHITIARSTEKKDNLDSNKDL
ncbi:uncharacterized protein METZ01_LOCUS151756, partial [marine metagenome]